MMSAADMAIAILFVLDTGMVLLLPALDRKLYGLRMKPVGSSFFLNMEYDEPINRFMLSKGGALLLSMICIAAIMLSRK